MKNIRFNLDNIAILIVFSAMLMNFVLSILNRYGLPMNHTKVVIIQLCITMGAFIVFWKRRPEVRDNFYIYCATLLCFAVVAMIYKENLNFQFLYKLFIIPIFILLGASVQNIEVKYLKWLLYFVLFVALIEAISPSFYIKMVNPFSYYISTREWVSRFAWNHQLKMSQGLYVGANRPLGSIFGFSDHRVGSVFLEPLSLGYFSVIYSIAICHIYRGKIKVLIPQLAICFILALLSDSRSSIFLIVGVIAAMLFIKKVPQKSLYFFPLCFFFFMLIIYQAGFVDSMHEYKFRLSITANALSDSSLEDLLFGKVVTLFKGDSGVVELVDGTGIIGILFFYITCSGIVSTKITNNYIIFCSMLFLMVTSLFGGAFFSIKTGSLLGFFIGAFGTGIQLFQKPGLS